MTEKHARVLSGAVQGMNVLVYRNLAGHWDRLGYSVVTLKVNEQFSSARAGHTQATLGNWYARGRDVVVETMILNSDNTYTVSIARDVALTPFATKVLSREQGDTRYMRNMKECPIRFMREHSEYGKYYIFAKYV